MNHAYSATIDGHTVLFLRQVDDFTVSAPIQDITDKVLTMIQQQLREPLKVLGKLELYNDLDITYGRHFLKVSYKSYLKNVLQSHDWIEPSTKPTKPPMKYDKKYFTEIHNTKGPDILEDQTISETTLVWDSNTVKALENYSLLLSHVDQKYYML